MALIKIKSESMDLADDYTFTGTVTGAGGGGKVHQIVTNATNSGNSSSSGSFVEANGNVTITPSASDSKILVFASFMYTNPQSNKAFFTIYRDISGGALTNLGNSGDGLMGAIYGNATRDSLTMHTYDTPSTTSTIEYKVYYRSANGSTVVFNPDGCNWTLTAIEVLA